MNGAHYPVLLYLGWKSRRGKEAHERRKTRRWERWLAAQERRDAGDHDVPQREAVEASPTTMSSLLVSSEAADFVSPTAASSTTNPTLVIPQVRFASYDSFATCRPRVAAMCKAFYHSANEQQPSSVLYEQFSSSGHQPKYTCWDAHLYIA